MIDQSSFIRQQGQTLCLCGDWSTAQLGALEDFVRQSSALKPEIADLQRLDSNGALVLYRWLGASALDLSGLTASQVQLLQLVVETAQGEPPQPTPPLGFLAAIGKHSLVNLVHGQQLLTFLGRISLLLLSLCASPRQLKLRLCLDVVQKDGVQAVPIISLLAFLLGAVIAFQAGLQLATYGANVFIVELVSLTMLRELSPLICAIIVAGRSGSAYAAQLATMQMNQEIQALRSLGQDPYVWLILPKLLGLLCVLPLLTVLSMLTGLGGGMLVASVQLELSPYEFLQRLGQEVDVIHVWVGLIKAPVFAFIIVMVGCMQGLLAKGGAEEVGRRTTRSVVQAIFLVIILDALFSILFSHLGW
ncbi:MlaE family ABC transporter permease [Nitrincola tapanii]|uniref:ABC transporter permease n=1 Tax=Nitrincola tapanii TaxID=1708751 RepID=A0A5A9W0F8_9GAMM|nr:ABC transporter permease [Nitrincola tapanii]KAA0873588.1 ABC transporter permease [Nitrincola tapanii]